MKFSRKFEIILSKCRVSRNFLKAVSQLLSPPLPRHSTLSTVMGHCAANGYALDAADGAADCNVDGTASVETCAADS